MGRVVIDGIGVHRLNDGEIGLRCRRCAAAARSAQAPDCPCCWNLKIEGREQAGVDCPDVMPVMRWSHADGTGQILPAAFFQACGFVVEQVHPAPGRRIGAERSHAWAVGGKCGSPGRPPVLGLTSIAPANRRGIEQGRKRRRPYARACPGPKKWRRVMASRYSSVKMHGLYSLVIVFVEIQHGARPPWSRARQFRWDRPPRPASIRPRYRASVRRLLCCW